jgi:alginate O-acetyltransferase complex protein AlgJ
MSEPSHHREPSWADWLTVSIFLAVMALPVAVRLAHLEPAPTQYENRNLSPVPTLAWSAKSLSTFPAAFESWYNDHFALRNQFIRWHHLWKLRALNVSPSPSVILGKDGWLFDDDTVAYFRAPPLSADELERWRKFFEERQDFVQSEKLPYLLVIAPSPCSIYPEFLPDSVRRGHRETRLDQLLRHMEKHSRVRILDVRPALLAAKRTGRLYNRTDTHWNDLGAYIAYTEIMKGVAAHFPGTEPLPLSAFQISTQPAAGGDIAKLLALPDVFQEEKIELVPLTPRRSRVAEWLPPGSNPPGAFSMKHDDPSRPKAIVFHDSFSYASLYPFLAGHFSEIWFHWNHYFGPGLQFDVNAGSGRTVQWNPGFLEGGENRVSVMVIHEFAERSLLYDAPPTLMEDSKAPIHSK